MLVLCLARSVSASLTAVASASWAFLSPTFGPSCAALSAALPESCAAFSACQRDLVITLDCIRLHAPISHAPISTGTKTARIGWYEEKNA